MTDEGLAGRPTPWGTVICLSITVLVLIASEFMPVALLTPIARELAITEGQTGQAIAFSGLFAVLTSLFGGALLARLDRRTVLLAFTGILVASGLSVALAPNYAVFMFGRALIGTAIGGYFSLTTAVLARIVPAPDLAKSLATLQGGSALAAVVAQPMGSFIGGLIGWRGAFLVVVPLGIIAFAWQAVVLPRLPPHGEGAAVRQTFGLLKDRTFALGMATMVLFFMGQFSLSTYLRPFLELITKLDVNLLSLVLLSIGLAGLAGTTLIPLALKRHLSGVLIAFPAALMTVALALIGLGSVGVLTAGLLIIWGFLTQPTPAAWTTWMTRVIPDRLEAGGAMFVALIQLAITAGAFAGGLLFDRVGWWSPFAFSAIAFLGSALAATAVWRATTTTLSCILERS